MANAITTEFRCRLVAGVGTVRPSPHRARHLPRPPGRSAEKGPEHAPCISVPLSRYAPCILTERRTGRRDTQTFVCVVSSARSFWRRAQTSRPLVSRRSFTNCWSEAAGGSLAQSPSRGAAGARRSLHYLLILQAPTSPKNTKIVTRGIFRTAKMENKEKRQNRT